MESPYDSPSTVCALCDLQRPRGCVKIEHNHIQLTGRWWQGVARPSSEGLVTSLVLPSVSDSGTSLCKWTLATNRPEHRALLQVTTATLIKRIARVPSPTAFQATQSNLESNLECDPFPEMPGVQEMEQCVRFQIFLGKDAYRNRLKVASTEMGQDLVRTNTQWFYQPVVCGKSWQLGLSSRVYSVLRFLLRYHVMFFS